MPVGTGSISVPAVTRTVTTLNPEGAGSLAEAISTAAVSGAYIDFAVGGNCNRINMGDLLIEQPGIQIRGETAPEVFNLVGCGLRIKRSETVCRNFRIVPGDRPGQPSATNRDCIGIEGESQPVEDITVQGMTLAYSVDGLMDVWTSRGDRISIIDNIFAEPLDLSPTTPHPSGQHSTCLLIAKGATNILIAGNLFAHWRYRAPVVGGPAHVLVMNNLHYNVRDMQWRIDGPGEAPGGTIKMAFIGNHSKMGPDSPWFRAAPHFEIIESDLATFPETRVYYEDNLPTAAATLIAQHSQYASMNPWPTSTPRVDALGFPLFTNVNPIDMTGQTPMPSEDVESYVLANAGPKDAEGNLRDSILETRIRSEVLDGSIGSLKNTVPAAERALFGFPDRAYASYAFAMVG